MSEWRFDLENVPKSQMSSYERKRGDKTEVVSKVDSVYFLAAYPDGRTVGRTRWLPDAGRYEGFAKGQQPVAFMPWPEHPGLPE